MPFDRARTEMTDSKGGRQLLIEQQDKTLTDISGTVGMLREQARVMGSEVVDQTMFVPHLLLSFCHENVADE